MFTTEACLPWYDAEHLQKHMEMCTATVPTATGAFDIKAGQGAMQGHTFGPDVFMKDYYDTITPWNTAKACRTGGELSLCKDPITKRMVDLSLATYVDDVAKTYVEEGGGQRAINRAVFESKRLATELEESGYGLNVDKTCAVIGPKGFGITPTSTRPT